MKDHSTMSTTGFLFNIAWKYALGFVWYKALLCRVIPQWGIHNSVFLLCGMGLSFALVASVLLHRWKTGWSSSACAVLPFGVYTVLTYAKTFETFIVITVSAALLIGVAYSSLLLTGRIPCVRPAVRRKIIWNRILRCIYAFLCIASAALMILMVGIGWNGYFSTGLLSASVAAKGADVEEINADTITANIDHVLKLQPHIWEELGTRDRLNVLQTVCNIEAHYLGIRDPVTIQATNLSEDTLGAYRDDMRLVLISLNHLENDPVEEVLDTVLHEVHHCYEHRLIEAYQETAPELQTLRLFRNASQYAQEAGNYVNPREDYFGYLNQSLELDSDTYAEHGVQEYYYRIQKWLAENAP